MSAKSDIFLVKNPLSGLDTMVGPASLHHRQPAASQLCNRLYSVCKKLFKQKLLKSESTVLHCIFRLSCEMTKSESKAELIKKLQDYYKKVC